VLCCALLQRSVQTARGSAKPLLATLLKAVGDLFVSTQQAACLDMLATITEVFGEVKGAPEVAAAQQQALEGASCTLCANQQPTRVCCCTCFRETQVAPNHASVLGRYLIAVAHWCRGWRAHMPMQTYEVTPYCIAAHVMLCLQVLLPLCHQCLSAALQLASQWPTQGTCCSRCCLLLMRTWCLPAT